MRGSAEPTCKVSARRWVAPVLAMALAVMGLLAVLAPHAAWAEPALTTPSGATSAELSSDGQDYGWLYRKADIWYDMSDDSPTLIKIDGRFYDMTSYQTGSYLENYPVDERYYEDGTLIYSFGGHFDLDAIVRSGSLPPYHSALVTVGFPGVTPRTRLFAMTGASAGDVKRIKFDDSLNAYWGPARNDPGAWTSLDDKLHYLDGWFEGCSNLVSVEGLAYLDTSEVLTMARMFAGCVQLEELDLSGFDTSQCLDMSGMFDGCNSLVTLTVGDGWTQSALADAAESQGGSVSKLTKSNMIYYRPMLVIDSFIYDSALCVTAPASETTGRCATFPVDMTCTRDGETVLYHAGDIIPDGAATYTIAGRTSVKDLSVRVVGDAELSIDAPRVEYAGTALEPSVVVEDGGTALIEGTDYQLTYANNVQDGTADVWIRGLGDYFGSRIEHFEIVDTSAYGLLYEDGLLLLKAGHRAPSPEQMSADVPLVKAMRFLDRSGALVSDAPWGELAGQIKRVQLDASLAGFKPQSLQGLFAGCTALTKVEGWGNLSTLELTSMEDLFAGCTALVSLDVAGLELSEGVSLAGMLRGCTALEQLNLGNLDASLVTSTEGMLEGCTAFTTLRTGAGWVNASDPDAALRLSGPAMRVEPSYERVDEGSVVPSGAAAYRVANLALQLTTVEMPRGTYTCTGIAIRPPIKVKLGDLVLSEGIDYELSYTDNIYPGTAKATVTGKGIFSGGLEIPFTIEAAVTSVGDRLVYTEDDVIYTLVVTRVTADGQVAEAALTQVIVNRSDMTELALPSQCTIGNVKVTLTTVSTKLRGTFRNVNTVIIGAKCTTISSRAFARAPKVKKLIVKSSRLKNVKNCLAGSKITQVNVKVRLSTSVRAKYKTWFTRNSGKSGIRYRYG